MKFLPSIPKVLTVSGLWMAGMVILSKLNGQNNDNNDCDYPTYCPPMLICFNSTGNWILCCDDEYDPGLFPYNNGVCINDCPEVCNGTNPNPPIESGPTGKPWWPWVLGFGTPIAAGICGFACYLGCKKKNKPDDVRAQIAEIKETVDDHGRKIDLYLGDQKQEVVVGEEDEEEKVINASYYRVYGDDDERKSRDAVSSKALVQAKIVRQEKKSKENEEDDDYLHVVSPGSADSSFSGLP